MNTHGRQNRSCLQLCTSYMHYMYPVLVYMQPKVRLPLNSKRVHFNNTHKPLTQEKVPSEQTNYMYCTVQSVHHYSLQQSLITTTTTTLATILGDHSDFFLPRPRPPLPLARPRPTDPRLRGALGCMRCLGQYHFSSSGGSE